MQNQKQRKELKELENQLHSLSAKPTRFEQRFMAERAEAARQLCHDAYRLYDRRAGRVEEEALWKKAAELFKISVMEAYPPNFWECFDQLKNGSANSLEVAIRFLEDDPWFFGSGYVKADLLRYIKKFELSEEQTQRIQRILLAAIKLRDRREFKYYCRLAARVDSPEFEQQITELCSDPDLNVQRRARWVEAAMQQMRRKLRDGNEAVQ